MLKNTMATMKWPEIKALVDKDAIVLLPLGVIEEHGPHLPLGTDSYTATIYCSSIKEKLEVEGYSVIIAPPFYWGVCQSTAGFIGSFNIRRETATALLIDLLTSLESFGFSRIVGVNGHGDIEHSLAIIDAFKHVCETSQIIATYAFDQWRLPHFGYTGEEDYLCPIKTQTIKVSDVEIPDVHAGDIESAIINRYYPHLFDAELASHLKPVALDDVDAEKWLFGGHIHELSSQGYLGSPGSYIYVDIDAYINDYSRRVSTAILSRLSMTK